MAGLWQHKQEMKKKRQLDIDNARAYRSDKEQLVTLDKRLGKGIGAKRERARLNARLEN